MTSHIVFISLFLGLASGLQPVDLQTDSTVKLVRIIVDGREVAALTQPPWHAVLDFGPQLDPREVQAIGFDHGGNEVGRATQVINLPRPTAEIEIALDNHTAGPTGATLHWRHLQFIQPKSAMLMLDKKTVKLDRDFHAQFPQVDWKHPHVIAAEMKFRDGTVARREVVAGGAVYDTAQSELTPILLNVTHEPSSLDTCLLLEGKPVRVSAVENPPALVIFVRDPDEHEALLTLGRWAGLRIRLDYDTSMRMLWPIPQTFADASSHMASLLFEPTTDVDATRLSLGSFLTHAYNGRYLDTPLQLADAVAVAGVRAISETRRRAVVLVLGRRKDESRHDPAVVRRYLADIGVPLFVWSFNGPHPEWGEAEDISSPMGLQSAAQRLRKTLAAQRIAWVDADPLKALRLRADERCGVDTVARLGAP